eukprot:TRINITY_DN24175_c0_g1_i2.p1 TRINITY_DN24175_c0_g1~~TRINITY_DN24175_c0_g1_i2.p1  ORF type:complete len:282 (+),score=40.82 TRINITY_DN24175_c0_g1_i2:102-848(+)
MVHPNAAVARREQERQEQNRLRRLSEVKTATPGATAGPGIVRPPSGRPGSASRSRPGSGRPRSRPPSAPASRSCGSTSLGPAGRDQPGRPPPMGNAPDVIQQKLIQHQLGPYQVAAAAAAAAANGARRARSEAAPKLQASFMTSPQRRFDDAQNHLPTGSEAERRALFEELQSWYFSLPTGSEDDAVLQEAAKEAFGCARPAVRSMKPPVMLLEEAAAAVKAKAAASPRSRDMLGISPGRLRPTHWQA